MNTQDPRVALTYLRGVLTEFPEEAQARITKRTEEYIATVNKQPSDDDKAVELMALTMACMRVTIALEEDE